MDCTCERTPAGWKCNACGWTYHKHTAKPPRRNCPKAAGTYAERLASEVDALLSARATDRTREELLAIGSQCEGCWDGGCPEGSPCRRLKLWRERLACGRCVRWISPDS
jgi:hypothetical protein